MGPKSNQPNRQKTTDNVRMQSAPAARSTTTQQQQTAAQSSILRKIVYVLLAIIIIAVVACGVYGFVNRHKLAGVDPNKYQAVFLTNGQVYFGRVSRASRDTVRITDIYYLQVQQSVQGQGGKDTDNKAKADTSLIKLGSELHGPEDTMYVPKSQILFWENLKGDGKVVDAIKNYQKK